MRPVALELAPGAAHVILLHALMKLGAVAYPLDPKLTAAERRLAREGFEPTLVVSEASDADGPEADLPLLGEHDLDALQCRILTSGTGGSPRAVGLTYGNHLWSAVSSAFNLGANPDDRWLCCLPLNHVAGLSIVMRSVIYGTGAIVHDRFDPERVEAAFARDGATMVSFVPVQLLRVLEAGVDLSNPRVILLGGGPVPLDLLEEATARWGPVIQVYGLTEAASMVTALAPAEARRKLGSAGRPLLTTHLRIQDGEILVQGPTVAPGYADEDGWLHTGDLGRIDEEGFLYVEDRLDDVIITGGENVMPTEVEEALLRHADVVEAAAIGRPDPRWQEAVEAVVVLRDGAAVDEEELRRHCAQSLAGYKVPKRVEFVAGLPRTESGKLIRERLRSPRGESLRRSA